MKVIQFPKFFILVSILLPIFLSGQNWQNICTPGNTFYKKGSELYGFRVTQIQPYANLDTLFTSIDGWQYLAICYYSGFGPVIGTKILKKNDGWFVFSTTFVSPDFSRVSLNSQAIQGDKWIMYRDYVNHNLLVEAEVTSVAMGTVLGNADSIKVFTLQAKDSTGNNLVNNINGKQIILSKHYGLVKTRNFNAFMSGEEYLLAGKSTPETGIQEITGKEIFDFQAGDIFHYTGTYNSANVPAYYKYNWEETREILSRDTIPGGYHYLVKRCLKKAYTVPVVKTTWYSGVSDVIHLYSSYTGDPYYRMPRECKESQTFGGTSIHWYDFSRTIRENNRQQKKIIACGYYYDHGCAYYGNGGCWPNDITLVSGLGIIHYDRVFLKDDDNLKNPVPAESSYDQVYYKKGNVTFGTPLAVPCVPFGYRVNPLNAMLFYRDAHGNVKTFRVDTGQALRGNDSLFTTFPAIRATGSNCLDTAGGSLLGRKLIQRGLGTYQFINAHQDTLSLNSMANMGTSWKFCSLPGGNYILASVLSVTAQKVLGVDDTVKVISFQAKNSAGVNIPHLMNGKPVHLSNSYGFTHVFDVTLAPDSLVFYDLAGISSPALGLQDLTWKRIYQFDIGDCFHYLRYQIVPGTPGDSVETKTILTIIGKTVHGNEDSITYVAARCSRAFHYPPAGSYILPGVADTITFTYSSESFPGTGWPAEQPDEFYAYISAGHGVADQYFMVDSSEFNRRQLRGSMTPGFNRNTQNCWLPALDTAATFRYADGLGLVLHASASPAKMDRYSERLVWFRKGTETWGTPIAVSCSALLGQEEIPGKAKIIAKVIPSPVRTDATVIVENLVPFQRSCFYLYDLTGKEIFSHVLERRETVINRHGIPGGFYTWMVLTPAGTVTGKAVFE